MILCSEVARYSDGDRFQWVHRLDLAGPQGAAWQAIAMVAGTLFAAVVAALVLHRVLERPLGQVARRVLRTRRVERLPAGPSAAHQEVVT